MVAEFFGSKLTDEQMKQTTYPKSELIMHVALRSVLTFDVLGLLVGSSVGLFSDQKLSVNTAIARAENYAAWGILIGLCMAPVMTVLRLKLVKANEDAVKDRVIRLRQNRNQVRIDRGLVVGAIWGSFFSSVLGQSSTFGVEIGLIAGVVVMALYNLLFSFKK